MFLLNNEQTSDTFCKLLTRNKNIYIQVSGFEPFFAIIQINLRYIIYKAAKLLNDNQEEKKKKINQV